MKPTAPPPLPTASRRGALRALSLPTLLRVLQPLPLAALPLAALPLAALALAGCAAAPPAPRLLRWPTQPAGPAPADARPAAVDGAWRLMPWGALPEWMDRQEVLVADGPAGLRALPGVRWAEPLRDALPRLLALDLGALRAPQPLWTDAVPAGARVDRLLRVQILALDSVPPDGPAKSGRVLLLARWSLADTSGQRPPLLADARIEQPWDGSADGLALAQRAALWTLARRLAQGEAPLRQGL